MLDFRRSRRNNFSALIKIDSKKKQLFMKPLSKDLAILVLLHFEKYRVPHGFHGFLFFCTINKSTYRIMCEHIVFTFTRPSFYNAKVHQGKMFVII